MIQGTVLVTKVYGHRLMVSWCFHRFTLHTWNQQRKKRRNIKEKIFSQYLQIGLHWGPPLTLTQALYNSTLAFTFYLDGARTPARYENVDFSGLLGACVLPLGMCMAFLIPWYMQKL